jgi:predicted RNA methylase
VRSSPLCVLSAIAIQRTIQERPILKRDKNEFWQFGDTVMNSRTNQDRWILQKVFDSLRKHGPLGTVRRITIIMRDRFDRVPGCKRLFHSIDKLLNNVQYYLDASFDRKYGVNTSGGMLLQDLTIAGNNLKECFWYEPMSPKVFRQIMHHLDINFSQFEFIDFGSGKGRVMLLASEYGFKKIIGVEFAQELHRIASKNVVLWNHNTRKRRTIETICMDAIEFAIPNVPLVIFFYSPFKGTVMEHVVNNVLTSYTMNSREIVLIFYGPYTETKKPLNLPEFQGRELELSADWSQFVKYRCFLFTNREIILQNSKE